MAKKTSKKTTTKKGPETATTKPTRARSRKAKEEATPEPTAPEPKGTKGKLSVAELSTRYLEHLEGLGKSTGTVFSYGIDLKLAERHFGAEAPVADLTEADILAFMESDLVTKTRKGGPKAVPTVAKTRRVLRLALQWAEREGLIPKARLPEGYAKSRKLKVDVTS